jgi:predicted Zn-dependent peptidase
MLNGSNTRSTGSPCRYHAGVRIEASPESQAYFALALPVPPYASDDRYYWYLLNAIIGGGMSSRLFRRIREEMGCVYRIDSELNAYRDAGILVVEGSTSPESLREVLSATMMELGKLAFGDQPVDDEELWTARMQLRGQHMLASENLNTRMSRLATQELYFGRHIDEDEVLRRINAVTIEELREFIDRALPPALGQIAVSVTGAVECVEHTEAAIQEIAACFQTAGSVVL